MKLWLKAITMQIILLFMLLILATACWLVISHMNYVEVAIVSAILSVVASSFGYAIVLAKKEVEEIEHEKSETV